MIKSAEGSIDTPWNQLIDVKMVVVPKLHLAGDFAKRTTCGTDREYIGEVVVYDTWREVIKYVAQSFRG
jgi:hypothetical protein